MYLYGIFMCRSKARVCLAASGESVRPCKDEIQLLQQANKHQLLSQNQLNMVGSEILLYRYVNDLRNTIYTFRYVLLVRLNTLYSICDMHKVYMYVHIVVVLMR